MVWRKNGKVQRTIYETCRGAVWKNLWKEWEQVQSLRIWGKRRIRFSKNLFFIHRGKTGKVGPSAIKSATSVAAFLVCNAVKAMVVVFTDLPGDIAQRRSFFFGTNAKRRVKMFYLGTFVN